MMKVKRRTALIVPLVMLISQTSAMHINLDDGAIQRHNGPPKPHLMPTEVMSDTSDNARTSECVSDTEGFFGDTNSNGLSLEYYYELDYDTRILHRVNQSVLKFLQNKISDLLIPVLFVRTCSNSRRELTERLRRRLEIIGISALPEDVILTGGTFQLEMLLCEYEGFSLSIYSPVFL